MKRFFGPRPLAALFLAVLILAAAGGAGAAEAVGGAFRKGGIRGSLFFGGATAFKQNYSVFGIGIGYFVADGVEAGLEAETWQGNDPGIKRISPQLTYVFPVPGTVKPYAGVFYRRTYIDSGYADHNDAGVRGGAYFLVGRNAYLGAGLVYEKHLTCDQKVYDSCAEAYPELLVAFVF